jgi:hypothetical protein
MSDEDPPDAVFVAALRAVPDDHWDQLWRAYAEVSNETNHLTWGGGQVDVQIVDGVERPVMHMPYAIYSDAVERLRSALGALTVPFAWPQWDGITRYRTGRGMAAAPVADAVRMVTAVIRSERFTDGSIAGAIEDGTLPAALERLRRWYEAEQEPAP